MKKRSRTKPGGNALTRLMYYFVLKLEHGHPASTSYLQKTSISGSYTFIALATITTILPSWQWPCWVVKTSCADMHVP